MEQATVTTNRRLERGDGPLGGVAAGMADYFNIDPTIVRLGLVATTLLGGPTIPIAYVAAWIIIPDGKRAAPSQAPAATTTPLAAAPPPPPAPPVPAPPVPAPAPVPPAPLTEAPVEADGLQDPIESTDAESTGRPSDGGVGADEPVDTLDPVDTVDTVDEAEDATTGDEDER